MNLEWPLVNELAGLILGQSKWTFCCREAFLGSELVLHPLVTRAHICPCMSHSHGALSLEFTILGRSRITHFVWFYL